MTDPLVLALRRKLAGYEAAGLTEKAARARERIARLEGAPETAGTEEVEEVEAVEAEAVESAGVDLTPAAPPPEEQDQPETDDDGD